MDIIEQISTGAKVNLLVNIVSRDLGRQITLRQESLKLHQKTSETIQELKTLIETSAPHMPPEFLDKWETQLSEILRLQESLTQ